MRAYQLFGPADTRLVETAVPEPGRGEALLRVLAVGVCHSDLHVRAGAAGTTWALPFTLGHEVCAVVEAFGGGDLAPDTELSAKSRPVAVGDQVLVHGPIGCGRCRRCTAGAENVCDRRASVTAAGVGLGRDGGMAEFLVTDARRLVPARGLAPVAAAPLTDAALTSLHAIRQATAIRQVAMAGDGAAPAPAVDDGRIEEVAVVIGAGGLGHVAVRLLRALTQARVVAVDTREAALELAARSGAHTTLAAGPAVRRALLELTDGRGADAVFDFVAAPTTAELGASALAAAGDLVLVGGGGGAVTVSKPGALPPDTRVSVPFWGSRGELAEVVELARAGVAQVATQAFDLGEASEVLGALERGEIVGRAVLTP